MRGTGIEPGGQYLETLLPTPLRTANHLCGINPIILSRAAQAFKAHALSAAALSPAVIVPTETFRSGSPWLPPYEPDLTPIG